MCGGQSQESCSSPSIFDRYDRISTTAGSEDRAIASRGVEDISSLQRASITSRAFLNGLQPTPRFAFRAQHKSPIFLSPLIVHVKRLQNVLRNISLPRPFPDAVTKRRLSQSYSPAAVLRYIFSDGFDSTIGRPQE